MNKYFIISISHARQFRHILGIGILSSIFGILSSIVRESTQFKQCENLVTVNLPLYAARLDFGGNSGGCGKQFRGGAAV
jgi:hypothetical protein